MYHDALTTLAAGSANTDLDGNYSRFAEKTLRVAVLLAGVQNGGQIELRHWARAQQIAERWRRSLHNLYLTLNTASTSPEAALEDQVVNVVQRLGGATVNDLRQYVRGVSFTEATLLLGRLAAAGALRVETTRKGTKRYLPVESET